RPPETILVGRTVLALEYGLKAFLHALLISGTLLSLSLASNKKIKAQGWKYVALFIRRAQALRYLNKAALGEIVAALERAPRELVSPAGERWKKREELAAKTEQAAATTDAKKNTDVDELAPFRAQVAIQSAPHTSSRSSTNSSRRRLLKATTAAEPAPVEDESKTPAPAAPEKEKVAIATEASARKSVKVEPKVDECSAPAAPAATDAAAAAPTSTTTAAAPVVTQEDIAATMENGTAAAGAVRPSCRSASRSRCNSQGRRRHILSS
ncbi:hypothetical protein A4X03_0g6775, partial [Tilletia caries]